jgi:cell division protein FtsQ
MNGVEERDHVRARRTGFVVTFVLAVGGLLCWAAFRDGPVLPVERVEVVGTRLLEPYAVVRAAGIDGRSSMVGQAAAWRAGMLTLPLVESVRVRRVFPGTVTLEVREVEPVALVPDGGLRVVDGRGEVVPVDPAGAGLDLPILVGVRLTRGRLEGDGAGAALVVLAALRERDPRLAEQVSQLEIPVEGSTAGLRLVLRSPGPELLLPLHAGVAHVDQLRLAMADLVGRGELRAARRVDVRFRDQVVVSFARAPVS